jgi:hypothetical protein
MKKTPLFRGLFPNQFLPVCPKTGKRPTKPLKNPKNWVAFASFPFYDSDIVKAYR